MARAPVFAPKNLVPRHFPQGLISACFTPKWAGEQQYVTPLSYGGSNTKHLEGEGSVSNYEPSGP